jgi:hypothetical protein
MWNPKRILKDLADTARRRRILTAFWRYSEPSARLLTAAQLAKIMHFRDESIRKMPNEKKAELLASRIGLPEFDEPLAMALMHYHTNETAEMLAAFLDHWKIPHENGAIENDDYTPPTADQIREAVKTLKQFDRRDVAIYLATAGLLMGDAWREASWPVVDEMSEKLSAEG